MKEKILFLTLIAFQSSAYAFSSVPLLVIEKGSLANNGRREVCEIYENHPALSGKGNQIREMIMHVSGVELSTVALFMKAQVPSVQIFAIETMISFVPQKIELQRIYSNHSAMATSDAKILIELAQELCL